MVIELPAHDAVRATVLAALEEDRAFQDATSLATVAPALSGKARFLAKQDGVLAGLFASEAAFELIDGRCTVRRYIAEGEPFRSGQVIAEVSGPVRAILQGERVALNLLQRMCAIATLTRRFVDTVRATGAVILDTRKTTPGLRDLEKYAVRAGGGMNHRRDLATMAMIKDNHREALAREGRTLAQGVAAIRSMSPDIAVEVEIDSLDQLDAALAAGPEWILLDNMPPGAMKTAVEHVAGRVRLEASGGVNLATVRAIAETGVDAISVGALTHSAGSLDISLDLEF